MDLPLESLERNTSPLTHPVRPMLDLGSAVLKGNKFVLFKPHNLWKFVSEGMAHWEIIFGHLLPHLTYKTLS